MKNADRLLRVIYKDSDFEKMMDYIETYRGGADNYRLCVDDESFMASTSQLYAKVYPSNYSAEEVENLLSVYLDHASVYAGNQTFTSAYNLFLYCADQLFFMKNNKILVKFDQLLEWDGFSNKVDANIVVAAFMALHGNQWQSDNTGAVVSHDNEALKRILKRGAADNHAHLKASGYSAEMSWTALITCNFDEDNNIEKFIKKSGILNDNFSKNRDSALLLIKKIKFIRLLLEEYLEQGASKKSLFTKSEIISILTGKSNYVFLHTKYSDWIDQRLDKLRMSYARMSEVKKYYILERQFLCNMFRALTDKSVDPLVQYLFEIYLASLSHIRFFFVQDNTGMGFDKFKSRDESKKCLLNLKTSSFRQLKINNEVYLSAFDRYYRSEIVKYVEFRIGPPNDDKALKKTLSDIDKAYKKVSEVYCQIDSSKEIKYGIIIHYIKEQKEPNLLNYKFRWEQFREELTKKTSVIITYLDKKQLLSEKIIGIDAANYEIECRPEVFAPVFRQHREVTGPQRPFGFTYHVGEVFDALASGLRAVDETIKFMGFKRGDRLGHAVALGIKIDSYKEAKRNRFAVSLQNHVDNLAWMYEQIQQIQETTHKILLHYLNSEFNKYVQQLYSDVNSVKDCNINIDDYIDSMVLRSDDPKIYLDANIFNNLAAYYHYDLLDKTYTFSRHISNHMRAFNNNVAVRLHKAYLCDSKLFDNGKKLIALEPSTEYWESLKVAQKCLRDKIYNKEIAIETNPSSNRKISHVSKFVDLPFLSFNRHNLTNLKDDDTVYDKDLPISINTDDCAIFQTDLANEYALIVAMLQRENYDIQEIYDYIDYLRNMSLLQTFIQIK